VSRRRRLAQAACDGALVISMLFAFAVTHFPTPSRIGSAESDASRQAVRGVWVGFAELARSVSHFMPPLPDWLPGDKAIHVALYVAPGLFAAGSLALRRGLHPRGASLLLVALTCWGALDELSQGLMHRDGEFGDVLANSLGAALGIGVVWFLASGIRRR
jgi:VanZ family protein